ncbi:hypothetical protein DSO57_1014528 [Entomophthora muscae]|uniref:Uncharacterized protein n=1 Tax=Entomophthora muscae TaxID=34485 RepID=A0ACC2U365_9FUNG|nr:hypothetical protein DSO57_1014528 [Entomophthora muscae]
MVYALVLKQLRASWRVLKPFRSLSLKPCHKANILILSQPRIEYRPYSTSVNDFKPKDNLSQVSGPTEPSLYQETIGELLDLRIKEHPAVLALISEHENIQWTYEQLGKKVDMLITGLAKLGIGYGDRVGVYMPNNAAWLLFQYALAKVGAILVSLNPGYRSYELSQTIKLTQIKALVSVPEYKDSDFIEIIGSIIPEIYQDDTEINTKSFPELRSIIFTCKDNEHIPSGSIKMASLMDKIEAPAKVNLACTDIINIQFTSGTTGLPKGVALTHENILNNGRFVGERQGVKAGEVICIPVPLYHCFGLVMGNLACLAIGGTALYPSPTFDPEASLIALEKHRAVALYGVPTMFIAMLNHPRFQKTNLSSLRTGVMAGSPCPVPIMEKVVKFMPHFTVCYGMTETGPVSFQTLPTTPKELRTTTVGCIMPHTYSRILKIKEDSLASVGEAGRLQVKGYLVMKGYWQNSTATENSIDKEGWMDTGDLASIDSEGYCRISGRSKDLVIRGGENLFPPEIEKSAAPPSLPFRCFCHWSA